MSQWALGVKPKAAARNRFRMSGTQASKYFGDMGVPPPLGKKSTFLKSFAA